MGNRSIARWKRTGTLFSEATLANFARLLMRSFLRPRSFYNWKKATGIVARERYVHVEELVSNLRKSGRSRCAYNLILGLYLRRFDTVFVLHK
ncbi:MAG: hypothetical protein OXE92_03265 [Bacteroidetes bacterium]|nr:hypothetical protein [Bacteroidota bacterium]MCY4204727.1 hypothetical protein [Bacteroidota bacterium]